MTVTTTLLPPPQSVFFAQRLKLVCPLKLFPTFWAPAQVYRYLAVLVIILVNTFGLTILGHTAERAREIAKRLAL